MSTMTATFRGTPSLTVAPTQNTAPVFEFRCLYTHDLRKKKKIWHDGSLRFHTFNRRVMVYDDSKNYIGDAHWRETGDFQEGEELKLDKGVMVEVGERIGQTETDLAPIILEKRRPDHASSPPRAALQANSYSSAMRANSTLSQARPRSLAAVLGASQGQIGRARIATRSPFEQRQDQIQRPEVCRESPAKKRKTGADKENVMYNPAPVRQIQCAGPQTTARLQLTNTVTSFSRGAPGFSRTYLTRNGDLFTQPPSSPPRLAPPVVPENVVKLTPAQQSLQGAQYPAPGSTELVRGSTSTSRSKPKPKPKPKRKQATVSGDDRKAESPTHLNGVVQSSSTGASTLRNRLRFANEKPRKKLIYKGLLPQVGVDKHPPRQRDPTRKRHGRSKSPTVEKKKVTARIPAEDRPIIDLVSEGEETAPFGTQTSGLRSMNGARKSTPRSRRQMTKSPSPLFVSQSPGHESLAASQQSLEEDFQPPKAVSPTGERSTRHGTTDVTTHRQSIPLSEHITDLHERIPACPEVSSAPTMRDSPSKLTLLDQHLLQTSAAAIASPKSRMHRESPKQRQFRRIRSEGDPQVECRPPISPQASLYDAAMQTSDPAWHKPDSHQKLFKSPSKIQRSISDTSYLVQRAGMADTAAPAAHAVEAAFDPWSEPEAYLLFDWWPPGRAKPSFATEGT
jgi:Protein of unknown function (DUF2439)